MLGNYRKIYSSQEVMSKKLCFSIAILHFNPVLSIIASNSPKSLPMSTKSFTAEQISEIREYLSNYNEKPYVVVADNTAYVILPSLFPTITAAIMLRMNMEPKIFLRFVKDRKDLFVLANDISIAPARMSKRLDAQRNDFMELCSDIERVFMSLDRFNLAFSDDEIIDGYYEQVCMLSRFLGVPLDSVSVNSDDDGVPIRSNFVLFTAFCTTFMMLAREQALDRKLSIKLSVSGGSIMVRISFKTAKPLKTTMETFAWEFLSFLKGIHFQFYDNDGCFCLSFEPLHIDWSYLEMKQNRNTDTFFDD